ncbi:unnamed protein product [Cuscuta epithymum]|nr:unnamed protein product [Cuscuta epithymum]
MISNVLFLRCGPVKKFQLQTFSSECTPQKSDLDLWCLFLSRNGIEKLQLCMELDENLPEYTLPFCLISCPTIKNLELEHVDFYFPVNAGRDNIFPSLTSLIFRTVVFNPNANRILLTIPNLEELVFENCVDIHYFAISAPRLKSLTLTYASTFNEWQWFELHAPVIKTLHFSACTFGGKHDDELDMQEIRIPMIPIAVNL